MKEINRIYTKNKIEKFGVNNTPKLNKYFTSILKLTIALALFLMAALFISGAGITVENGDLNVSNSLIVNTTTLYVNSASGLVGIGMTSPGEKLDVNGNLRLAWQNYYRSLNSAGTSVDIIQVDGANNLVFGSSAGGVNDMTFKLGGTEYMRIQGGSGNVGIGTTGPQTLLHVDGTTGAASIITGNDRGFGVRNAAGTANLRVIYVGASNEMVIGNGADDIRLFTNNAAPAVQVRITSTGNVGIGTASPTRTLHVSGNANITGNLAYVTLSQNSPNLIWTEKAFVTCAKAIDGRWYVEYVDGNLNTIRECVDSANTAWQHRECYEKIQTTTYYFSLNLNESSMPKPENLYFDWNDMQVHQKVPVNQTI